MDSQENILLQKINERKLTLKKELDLLCVELGFAKVLSKKFVKGYVEGRATLILN